MKAAMNKSCGSVSVGAQICHSFFFEKQDDMTDTHKNFPPNFCN